MELFHRFITEQQGADAVEYALVIALIALAIVAGASFLGTQINSKLNNLGTSVANCGTSSKSC